MKKFLLMVMLVGAVFSQIFFSSTAEAYNEGDELDVYKYICYNCDRIGYSIILNGKTIQDDRHVDDDCPFWDSGSSRGYYRPEAPRPHRWMSYMGEESKHYVYRNGQWVEKN